MNENKEFSHHLSHLKARVTTTRRTIKRLHKLQDATMISAQGPTLIPGQLKSKLTQEPPEQPWAEHSKNSGNDR